MAFQVSSKKDKKCTVYVSRVEGKTKIKIDCNKEDFYDLLKEVLNDVIWFF